MIIAKELLTIEDRKNNFLIKTNGPYINIYFMTDDILRIRVSFDKEFLEESYILTLTAWEDRFDKFLAGDRKKIEALSIGYKEDDEKITFTTKTLQVFINKNPYSLEIFNRNN